MSTTGAECWFEQHGLFASAFRVLDSEREFATNLSLAGLNDELIEPGLQFCLGRLANMRLNDASRNGLVLEGI